MGVHVRETIWVLRGPWVLRRGILHARVRRYQSCTRGLLGGGED